MKPSIKRGDLLIEFVKGKDRGESFSYLWFGIGNIGKEVGPTFLAAMDARSDMEALKNLKEMIDACFTSASRASARKE